MGRSGGGRIAAVQALRGLAAVSVVAAHCWLLAWHGDPHWRAHLPELPFNGGGGVDLFFVISGFIMVHATRHLHARVDRRWLFILRRLIRVVPLHWIVTACCLIWFAWKGPRPDATLAALSFVFVPFSADGGLVHVVPINPPAWTLGFEMLFYALFALCLAGSARATVMRTSLALAVLVALGMALPAAAPAWAFAATRPLLLEFIAGMALGLAHGAGWRLPGWLGGALLAGGAVLLFWPFDQPGHWQGWGRIAPALPAAAAMVAGAVLADGGAVPGRVMQALGDASYSLYLWHMLLLEVLRRAWLHAPWVPGAAYALAGFALAIALGLASYRWLERPLLAALRRRFLPPATPA